MTTGDLMERLRQIEYLHGSLVVVGGSEETVGKVVVIDADPQGKESARVTVTEDGKALAFPKMCPGCGCKDLSAPLVEWEARSKDPQDRDNTATLTEYQCISCALAFWL